MTWISPRESAGFKILAAFMLPSASPVPTRLWTSSIKRMMLPSSLTSSSRPLMRLSNWPRNCVPATSAVKSSRWISFFCRRAGTLPSAMRSAKPSATAVLPTPGSPIKHGLFFVRRDKICTTRSSSLSRPMMRSMLPLRARAVKSVQYAFKWRRFERGFSRRRSFVPVSPPDGCCAPSDAFGAPKTFCRKAGNVAAPPGTKPPVWPSPSSSPGFISWPSSASMASICSSVIPIFSIKSLTGLMPSSFAQERHSPCGSPFVSADEETNTTAGRL